MIEALTGAGLREVQIVERFDCFRATRKERTARRYGVHAANFLAWKPQGEV
jgi:hypothetical protein